ncbi:MAG: hypothetical protein OXU25_01960 [Thaumarchaeota archaeon]|nr:hypothetical protein [Nitrososphaerota archaeon]
MRSFSEQYGYSPEKEIQVDTMDDDLKRRISDVIYEHLYIIPAKLVWTRWIKRDVAEMVKHQKEDEWYTLGEHFVSDVWNDTLKAILMQKIKKTSTHNEIYDLVQLVVQGMREDEVQDYFGRTWKKSQFVDDMNAVLEENRSGWRIDNDMIVPVMEGKELEAVHKAASISETNAQCVKMAMQAMGVVSPDYRASIAHSAGMAEGTLDTIGAVGNGMSTKLDSVAGRLGVPDEIVASFKRMNDFANRHARHPNQKSGYAAGRDDAMLALVSFSAMSAYLHGRWKAMGGSP